MHFIGSLIKLNRISEVLLHVRFFDNLIKSWKVRLVTYKNMQKVQAVPTRAVVSVESWGAEVPAFETRATFFWVCKIRQGQRVLFKIYIFLRRLSQMIFFLLSIRKRPFRALKVFRLRSMFLKKFYSHDFYFFDVFS